MQALAADPPIFNQGLARFKAANGQSQCLHTAAGSERRLHLAECDADKPENNWYMDPWNQYGLFQLRNYARDQCLDFSRDGTEAYISPCDEDDSGQVLRYDCKSHALMAMGPTSVLYWWNDRTVSAGMVDSGNVKTQWTVHPKVPQSCR